MLLVKAFLIHVLKTKMFPEKHVLQNAARKKHFQRTLIINFPRNLKTVSTILDLFSNIQIFQINHIFPKNPAVTFILSPLPYFDVKL